MRLRLGVEIDLGNAERKIRIWRYVLRSRRCVTSAKWSGAMVAFSWFARIRGTSSARA